MAEDTEDKEELSMEDILSSIKDILMEDNAEQHKAAQKEEPAPQAAAPQPASEVSRPAPAETVDDVLTLSPSMIVEPNISTVEAQPETKAEEGADPNNLVPSSMGFVDNHSFSGSTVRYVPCRV